MDYCTDIEELIDDGVNRIITQYRESPNLLFLLRSYLQAVAEANAAVCNLPDYFTIDGAIGDQLTILGKRMGFPRCHCVCSTPPLNGFSCDEVGEDAASGNVVTGLYRRTNQTVSIGDVFAVTQPIAASYVDADGVLQFAADTPRIDYSTGSPVLLVEAAATNRLIKSEDMSLCLPNRSNTNVTANTASGPDGLTKMDKFVPTAVSSAHYAEKLSISATTNEPKCFSIYVRAAEYSRFSLRIYDGVPTNYISATYNLSDLTSSAGGGGTSSARAAGLIDCGGGLYRAWVSGIPAASDSGSLYGCRVLVLNASGLDTYTGDGVGGIHAGYAQLEDGSYPSSYIPTTSLAITRPTDELTFKAEGTNDWAIWTEDGDKLLVDNHSSDLLVTPIDLGTNRLIAWKAKSNAIAPFNIFGQTIVGFCEEGEWEDCGGSGTSEICILDDELYRKFLKSRSYQFRGLYEYDNLLEAVREIFGPQAKILEASVGRVVVAPLRELTSTELSVIRLVPRVLPIVPGIRVLFHFGTDEFIAGFGEGWGGWCNSVAAGSLFEDESGTLLFITEDGAALFVSEDYTVDAQWLCPIDVKPYSC